MLLYESDKFALQKCPYFFPSGLRKKGTTISLLFNRTRSQGKNLKIWLKIHVFIYLYPDTPKSWSPIIQNSFLIFMTTHHKILERHYPHSHCQYSVNKVSIQCLFSHYSQTSLTEVSHTNLDKPKTNKEK